MDTITRATQSLGTSSHAIYAMVERAIADHAIECKTVIDVGCGTGNLRPFVIRQFGSFNIDHCTNRYIGVDGIQYDGFPTNAEFVLQDLEYPITNLDSNLADVVVSVETIEHLENPRAFYRELSRLAKPGGLVLVTTPNQLSLLSKLTLLLKNQFNAFQDAPGSYPSHITALLEIDLRRIAKECGLTPIEIRYSNRGRMVLTPWYYPNRVFRGQWFSDNVLCISRKPFEVGKRQSSSPSLEVAL
ncbi:class I SAM-dependent methyltransferase [Myxacorys almedinensis]|uniref:Methyltransferase domain-containing protein n=1 Tax=Myxacorys almedinensis A TaxID=2690445 RepID=A0A8J7YX40_9CYAN|nr:methyltransferase domain-containing protein [Myxacorys almedinensis]NDJ16214.1 methyltransferase domain-containing protein [Myxacorys almedinensis A]